MLDYIVFVCRPSLQLSTDVLMMKFIQRLFIVFGFVMALDWCLDGLRSSVVNEVVTSSTPR